MRDQIKYLGSRGRQIYVGLVLTDYRWGESWTEGRGQKMFFAVMKKNQKTIFLPGFTTRKRGWGLRLSLAKRIIVEYHKGKIYVKESKLGEGTKFRIELKS